MSKRRVAFIFARGGSKGVLNKNIRHLADKPLIGYAIETAFACNCFDDVLVSTDSPEIAAIARMFGASTPFLRPAYLSTDTASEWDAWRHAIRFVLDSTGPFDTFVSLPTTSPFRNVTDVTTCIKMLESDHDANIVITGRRSNRSPYFNMVSKDKQGYVHLLIPSEKTLIRRQDAPQIYDITTVAYVSYPDFILKAPNIWYGNIRLHEVPEERALDIDTAFDFFIAECIAKAYPRNHMA